MHLERADLEMVNKHEIKASYFTVARSCRWHLMKS